MNYDNFLDLEHKIEDLFKQREFNQLITVIQNNLPSFPNQRYSLLNTLTYCLTQENEYEKALDVWEMGLKEGFYFGIPTSNPMFHPYLENPRFEEIRKKNQERLTAAQRTSVRKYEVVLPQDFSPNIPYPLFIVLHGGGDSLKGAKPHWRSSILDKKYIVVFVQSSQLRGMDVFGWDDVSKGQQDIFDCFTEIRKKYQINLDRSIIGGISAGGKMSLKMVLSDQFPIKKFLAMVPVKYDDFRKDLEQAKNAKITGIIITGLQDTVYYSHQKAIIEGFKNYTYQIKVIEYKDLGHTYSENFSKDIDEAIEFLINWF